MSQLRVSGAGQPDFYLNVVNMDAPIFGEMNSGQTQSKVQWFPIKSFQPELAVDVIFPNEALWQQWQSWVRQNMVNSQNSNNTGQPGVTLNWPQRNIYAWTAIIPSAKAGGLRFNYTPRTRIEFQTIRNLVSELAVVASSGSEWQTLTQNGKASPNAAPNPVTGGALTSGLANLIPGLAASLLGL